MLTYFGLDGWFKLSFCKSIKDINALPVRGQVTENNNHNCLENVCFFHDNFIQHLLVGDDYNNIYKNSHRHMDISI